MTTVIFILFECAMFDLYYLHLFNFDSFRTSVYHE